ncbi:hypothetical protein ALC56_10996 [Trachymyrmex septentrionalis]|uniref:Uncharacterized protein n=1 Tax=Trachymyrmex septentrionalis TaxID=34720 RepID=A0A195F348_9HYME|nr:hypothetical protein ALC56_10996 [Trachymyrmex septentrionalis]
MPRVPRKFNFESYYIRCARYRHEPRSEREPKWKEEEEEIEEGGSGDLRGYKRDGDSRIEQQKGRGGEDSEEKRKKRGGWRICSRASSQANSQLVGQPPRRAEKRKGEQEDG